MNQEVIRTMSFDELLTEFLLFLQQEKSYKQSTLTNYYRKLFKVQLFMQNHRIFYYTPDIGLKYYDLYLAAHNIGVPTQKAILLTINRFNDFYSGIDYVVQHTKRCKLLPENYEIALNLFATKCYENCNKENTFIKKDHFLRLFLKDCIALNCTCIQELNATHVSRACLRVTNKDSWSVIREFLKFLAIIGILKTDLSTLVPHYKHSFKVPVIYSEEEIAKIENIIDRSTEIGKRDYAMILMATRLGMRSGDIVNITLDDLNSKSGNLAFVQQKTGEALVLPLLPEIKKALDDYINNSRPKTSERRVFIRQNAPHQRITTSTLRFVTTKYFHAAGIDIAGKKHGPHTFRSSLASSMVNDSVPYEAVRKILGHSNLKSIKHYAKLNIEMLRQCAITVPEPTGNFKEFLQGGGIL
ncbi:MAG: tyrosine-type recombinase/integrase [Peptostreptococcaceae bacterium]|nr:tyrosine-type recombinase/integrase [Peptostreptococcaceae bacterium]